MRELAVLLGLPWYLLSASAVALVRVTLPGASFRPPPARRAAMGARTGHVMDKGRRH